MVVDVVRGWAPGAALVGARRGEPLTAAPLLSAISFIAFSYIGPVAACPQRMPRRPAAPCLPCVPCTLDDVWRPAHTAVNMHCRRNSLAV